MITSWTHPNTGETITRNAIESLVHQWQTTPREGAKRMAWDQLHRFGVTLAEIISALERDLSRGYDILEASPNDENEARWLSWVESYETACDALSLIEHTVVDDRSELVTHRHGDDERMVA